MKAIESSNGLECCPHCDSILDFVLEADETICDIDGFDTDCPSCGEAIEVDLIANLECNIEKVTVYAD